MNNTSFQSALDRAIHHAADHLNSLDHSSVAATATLEELRRRLNRPINDEGLDAAQVVDDLAADVSGGLLGTPGSRFFGWVIGGALPAALAADWLTSVWDQNSGLYATSPAAAVVEEVCGVWLKEALGLPMTASFGLVTGCQMAHVTCLAAARHAVLERFGWDVENNGLAGSPPITIFTSGQRHASFTRAVRLLGLGTNNIIDLPEDDQGRLSPNALAQALNEKPDGPTIVLLQAGDLNIGAFDSFKELIPIAHKYGAWVHVDGAFGLWVQAAPARRHLLAGVELADSWSADGHKWLNVPFDCGYAFTAHPQAHRAALTQDASYIALDSDARDQMNWNPEWSRRARGFATYAAFRQLGRLGLADLVERCCVHAHSLVTRIGALPGAEMVWEPQINQGLVRFLDPSPSAPEAEHDRRTNEVTAAILQSGEAFFTNGTWRGKRCMRVSVCNWQTTDADVDRVVEAVGRVLAYSKETNRS